MRLACPSCDLAYDVPDDRLKPGLRVRCAQCRTEWVPLQDPPDTSAAADDDDMEPLPDYAEEFVGGPAAGFSALDRLVTPPPPPRASNALRAAWALSIVLLIALLGAGYAGRQTVMQHWPPSARFYSMFGISADAQPLPQRPSVNH